MKYIAIILILISCKNSNEFTGIDYKGVEKSCEPMKEKMCTEIFTPADQFSIDCKEKGMKPIQCDCHDWICVK